MAADAGLKRLVRHQLARRIWRPGTEPGAEIHIRNGEQIGTYNGAKTLDGMKDYLKSMKDGKSRTPDEMEDLPPPPPRKKPKAKKKKSNEEL